MPEIAWHPSSEAEAASIRAGFVEWSRATRRRPDASPDDLRRWATQDPSGFAAAFAAFAGLEPRIAAPPRASGTLVLYRRGTRRAWLGGALPEDIAGQLIALPWGELLGLVADHLLEANTSQDHRLLWVGQPDPWPLATLFAGATLILVDDRDADPAAVAAVERAVPLRPRPSAQAPG